MDRLLVARWAATLGERPLTDWDQAFSNRDHVGTANAEAIIAGWQSSAQAYRAFMVPSGRCREGIAYADGPRNRYDLFLPAGETRGTAIFIHGGYWRMLDRSFFSHLAAGPVAHGWAVTMPSYTLAPQARIGVISREIAQAVEAIAAEYPGPLRLIGHSAGGHLVARMLCDDGILPANVVSRIENTVAVSGLFDLENLRHTQMNDDFRLDDKEIAAESPARLSPVKSTRITCLVGAAELPEFLRQNDLLIPWREHGAKVKTITDQGKHHFSVIDPLVEPASLITMALMA